MNRPERIDPAAISAPREHRFTVAEVRALFDSGAFPETLDVELVEGRIVDLPPETPSHLHAVARMTRWFVVALDRTPTLADRFEAFGPATLLFGSEDYAVPDGLICTKVPRDRLPVPADVALALETTVRRRDYDLGDKPRRYAQAGVQELWVYEPEAQRLTVHRDPGPDGYRSIRPYGPGEAIAPVFAPGLLFDLATLA